MEFPSHGAAVQHIVGVLEANSFPNELAIVVAEEVTREIAHPQKSSVDPLESRRLLLPGGSGWVVRNDDLQAVDAVASGLQISGGLAMLGYLVGDVGLAAVASAISGSIATTFKLLVRISKKGAHINSIQMQLINLLVSRSEGFSIDELVACLNQQTESEETVWTPEQVEEELNLLLKVRLRDGTVVALVAEDSSGCWGACSL